MYVPQIPSSLRILLIVFLFCNSYASDVHASLANRSVGDSKTDQKKGGTASPAGDKKAGSSSSAPKGAAGSDGSKPVDGNKNASNNSPTSGHGKSSDNMTPENVRKASSGKTSEQSDSLMDRGDTGTQEANQTSTQRGGSSHRQNDEVLDSGHRDEDSFSRFDDVSDAGDSSRDLAGAGAEIGGAVIGAKSARNQAVIAAEAEKEAAEIEREAAREQAEIAADASLGEAEIVADASLEEAEIAADSALDEALVSGGLGVAGTVASNVSSREGGGSDGFEGGSEQDQEDSDTEDGSGDDYGDDGYESGGDEDGMGGGGATASNAPGKVDEEGTSPASESERQALAAKGLKGTSVGTGSGEGGARAKAKKGGGVAKLKPGTMMLVIQGAKGTKPQIKALPKGTRAVCFTVTPGVQGKVSPKAAKKSSTRVLKSRSLEMKKVRASERLSRDLDKLGAQTEAIEKALDALQAEVQRLAASPKI